MRGLRGLCFGLLLALLSSIFGFHIPPEVEQLPTITTHPPRSIIALPFEDNFILTCEATGNPKPVYHWTKDGQDFNPYKGTRVIKHENNGSFVIPNNKNIVQYRGKYRCYASNKLGTVVSEETAFIVPSSPKFPKEKLKPVVVREGDSVVLECNPPEGIPPIQIYWMTIGLQHIEQNDRVSMGLDGNLYFSNTLPKDSRSDYCCYASFTSIRTIVQKNAMAINVMLVDSSSGTNLSGLQRKPKLLVPSTDVSEIKIVKGDELELECIAEGLPTPTIQWAKKGEKLPKRTNIKNYGKLLTITNVSEEDSGGYICTANNSAGETVHQFQVSVEEPPRWLEEPTKNQVVIIGSDVHIKCRAAGTPRPTITWMKNGEPLQEFQSPHGRVVDDTIILHKVQPRDTAVYQCGASNTHGTLLGTANVMVMNLPPLILTQDYQEYATVLEKSVVLHCKVFSSPPATIHWKKEDPEGSVEGERFSFHKNGSLLIHAAKMEDTGKYMCSATNSEGSSSISAELLIKEPTRIVTPPRDLEVKRGSVGELVCQAECDQTLSRDADLEILWLKDGIEIYTNYTDYGGYLVDGGTLQIFNVSHSGGGVYTCIARTVLDHDTASAHITVLDVPDPPVGLTLSDLRDRSVQLGWTPTNDHNSPISEFIIEYEENHWEPGNWRPLLRVSGHQNTAPLSLYGHINYQFRVSAVNAIGKGRPSKPSERYKTPPAAPDRNPENIKIEGHSPHQMDITWEPLLPVEHNGPGLEYKLSYRRMGVEENWTDKIVKRHSFVVKDTPTFIPYEIKIQAFNNHGSAPEPKVVTGYSGEDLPAAAPANVSVEVLNSTLLRVSWSPVPQAQLRGHLAGYSLHWWRTRSLLTSKEVSAEKQSLTLLGNRSHAVVPGLKPFSEYQLTLNVFNRRGNGPSSSPLTFKTPQGVPERPPILRATNPQGNSITLVWAPPPEANGKLTGYRLHYQIINETQEASELYTVNISSPDTTQWVLHNLDTGSQYKFYLSACTAVGCGPAISEEGATETLARQPFSFTSSHSVIPPDNATLPTLELLNVSSSVSDRSAKISWTARGRQLNSDIYVAVMDPRDSIWKISEAVNATFHIIEGLEPGTVYKVRLLASNTADNSSIHEEVLQTRGKGMAGVYGNISSRGWFVGIMCAVALLTLVALIACFVTRNKGGIYAVKEKEDARPDLEARGLSEETSCEYSDSDEKPLKSCLRSLERDVHGDDSCSEGSSGEYEDEDEDCEFDEDGSFIGEYASHRPRPSTEVNGHPTGTA